MIERLIFDLLNAGTELTLGCQAAGVAAPAERRAKILEIQGTEFITGDLRRLDEYGPSLGEFDQIILLEFDESDTLSWVLSQNEDRTYALEVRKRHAF